MDDLNDKITGGSLTAAEWNQVPSEIQNVIAAAGITLSGADLSQLLKAIQNLGGRSNYYDVTGTPDAIVLTSPSGVEPFQSYFAGMELIFIVANGDENTGAVTINVDGIGVDDVNATYNISSIPCVGNELRGLTRLVYDGNRFTLQEPYAPIQDGVGVQGIQSDLLTRSNLIKLASPGNVMTVGDVNADMIVNCETSYEVNMGIEKAFSADLNGASNMFYNNVLSLKTDDGTVGVSVSGSLVLDSNGSFQYVGFNVMPPQINSLLKTVLREDCGNILEHTGIAVTYTIEASANIPLGATWVIANNGTADLTIALTDGVMKWLDGGGSSPLPTGSRTLGIGGVATITKIIDDVTPANNEYRIWGSNLT